LCAYQAVEANEAVAGHDKSGLRMKKPHNSSLSNRHNMSWANRSNTTPWESLACATFFDEIVAAARRLCDFPELLAQGEGKTSAGAG
jgi:hypothetical protein